MQYCVVQAASVEGLETAVRKKIEEGFEPQGGVAHLPIAYGTTTLAQAMVKTERMVMCLDNVDPEDIDRIKKVFAQQTSGSITQSLIDSRRPE